MTSRHLHAAAVAFMLGVSAAVPAHAQLDRAMELQNRRANGNSGDQVPPDDMRRGDRNYQRPAPGRGEQIRSDRGYERGNDRRQDGYRQDGYRYERDHDRRYEGSRYDRGEQFRHDRGAGPYHNWYRGSRLPPEYRSRTYVVDDWRGHRLSAPPRGYHWVQSGSDYLLVAIATGLIAQVLLNQ